MTRRTRRDFLQQSSRLLAGGALAGLHGCGSAEPQAGADDRPNLLFFFPDQHRPDWLGPGSGGLAALRTPNIDRLARDGVNFTKALVPSPVCAPSRACLASGREYDRCGVSSNRFDYPLDQTTFYGRLRDSGYHTMAVGKLDMSKNSGNWGMDGTNFADEWGFSAQINNCGKGDGMQSYLEDPEGPKDPYYAYLDSLEPPQGKACAEDLLRRRSGFPDTWWADVITSPLGPEAYCDNWIARNGLDLIDAAPRDQPWHLVINFVGPHPPVDITAGMETQVRGRDGLGQPFAYEGALTPAEHVALRQNYAAMIENIDAWLGRYIEMLEETGQLDNTIIVYSSDHGEMLGDHALWGKSLPYQASAGVPLLAAGPGIRTGYECNLPTTVLDLAATFLDYAGLATPADMDSRSLRPLLEGRTDSHRDVVLSGLRDWRLAYDGRYKLVTDFEGEDVLWDLEADPMEAENLAASQPEEVRRLREYLPG